MKGDRVEALVDTGQGVQTFEITASKAGRRIEVVTTRGDIEVREVTRTGTPVRTGRIMGMAAGIAFSALPGGEPSHDDVLAAALGLLGDDAAWTGAMRSARARADASLSFAAFRKAWNNVAASLRGLTGRRGPA